VSQYYGPPWPVTGITLPLIIIIIIIIIITATTLVRIFVLPTIHCFCRYCFGTIKSKTSPTDHNGMICAPSLMRIGPMIGKFALVDLTLWCSCWNFCIVDLSGRF
jgi:hypothetical protein